jgi:putative N-acetylmannosamine-6-phosphate epimerase
MYTFQGEYLGDHNRGFFSWRNRGMKRIQDDVDVPRIYLVDKDYEVEQKRMTNFSMQC